MSPPVGFAADSPAAKLEEDATGPLTTPRGESENLDATRSADGSNLTYVNVSNGFLTDGAWALQFGLARIDGSGYPSVVTMRGHDDILCKTQAWHVFSFDGKDSWSHSENPVNYGYGGYNVGLAEGNNWLFGGGAHHGSGGRNFRVVSPGGGDMSNGLTTPEPMYWGWAPAFGDFDSDGKVDVVANASPWSGSNITSSTFVYRGPAGNWNRTQIIDKQWNVQHGIKFADFDRDGFLDMASSNDILREPGHFIWRYNNELGKFEPWTNDLDLAMRNAPFDIGDINRDGLPDVAMLHRYKVGQDWKRDLEAYLQGPPGTFTSSSTGLPKDSRVSHLRLWDMDADGRLDIAAVETISGGYASALRVWLNDGAGGWTPSVVNIQGNILAQADWLEVDDIDNNGRGDFVFPENWGDCSEGGGFRAYKESSPVSELKVWVDEPWGGERWFPGSIRYIKWRGAMPKSSDCSMGGTLEYSVSGPSGPWKKIDDMLACAGMYSWKVPNDPSKNVFVKMSLGSAEGLSGGGVLPFEIIGGSAIPLLAAISSPAGSEVWAVGSTQQVAWSASGGQTPYTFDVEYSVTGSSGPWKSIATGIAKADHSWTVPDDPTANAVVRVLAKDTSSPQQSAIAVSKEFTIHRPPAPMHATLKADPTTLGSGGQSVLSLELTDAGGAGVTGANVAISADEGGTVSPPSEKGGGVYEATLTAPGVNSKTSVTVSANATRPGFINAAANVLIEVSPFLPDLSVVDGSFAVEGAGVEGAKASARAKITNDGRSDAGEFAVRFLVDGKESGRQTVNGLAVSETRDVSSEWMATKGKHELKIVLDPDNKIKEGDETNNQASTAVEVAAVPRGFEIPWWVYLLIAAVVAGLIAAAAAGRRKKACKWCNTRHADGAYCPGAGWR